MTGGTLTVLASFNGTDGDVPQHTLTMGGSTLYGMTTGGGAQGRDDLFTRSGPRAVVGRADGFRRERPGTGHLAPQGRQTSRVDANRSAACRRCCYAFRDATFAARGKDCIARTKVAWRIVLGQRN